MSRNYSAVTASTLFIMLGGCSKPPASTVSEPLKQSAISQNLPKLPGATSWNIESVGPVNEAFKYKTFQVPGRGRIPITGWAVDNQAKAAAGGVEISVDGTLYVAQYGNPRPDVADAFGVPAYTKSGYTADLSGGQFAAGTHTMFVRILTQDKKAFWEIGPYTMEIK